MCIFYHEESPVFQKKKRTNVCQVVVSFYDFGIFDEMIQFLPN